MRRTNPTVFWSIVGCAAFVGFILLIIIIGGVSYVKTDGGHVAVVRNGGPFDNNQIRDVIQPGSSRKFEGMYSSVHNYPASQRFYTISANSGLGDRPGVDNFQSSTSDGQTVGIEGSVQFTLNTDPKVLKEFDNKFGTRTFPVVGSDSSKHPWDGDEGWSAFLDGPFRTQVLDNALRTEIQSVKCADLNPSCQYATVDIAAIKTGRAQPKPSGQTANANIAAIQTRIAKSLQSDLDSTLGGHYIVISKFNIARATLSGAVQRKIEEANAAKVEVQRQQFLADQRVATANGQRDADKARAAGKEALNKAYAKSPQLAKIDAIKALCGDTGCQNLTVLGGSSSNLLNLQK